MEARRFSTRTDNDIYNVVDTQMTGFGYFTNVGSTLRQGVETQVNYKWKDVTLHASYTYMYATFQSTFQLNSFAPSYQPSGVETITPGDEMPMIPRQRIKIGADWAVTPKATVGTDMLYVGAQRYVGDEANQNPKRRPISHSACTPPTRCSTMSRFTHAARISGPALLPLRDLFRHQPAVPGFFRSAQRDAGAAALGLCRPARDF